MKSVVFERQQGNLDAALQTVDTAISKFPKFAKLYMIKGQTLEDKGDLSGARAAYAAGIKACPKVPTLWILASRLEERDNRAIKARALLEKARLVNPKDEEVWVEAVGIEERNSGAQQAKAVLARGMSLIFHMILDAFSPVRSLYRLTRMPNLWHVVVAFCDV